MHFIYQMLWLGSKIIKIPFKLSFDRLQNIHVEVYIHICMLLQCFAFSKYFSSTLTTFTFLMHIQGNDES